VAPTIGIQDIGQQAGTSIGNELFLFLFRRKEEWASCWDSRINKCHSGRYSESLEGDFDEAEDDVDNDDDGNDGNDGNDDVDYDDIDGDDNDNIVEDLEADEHSEADDANNDEVVDSDNDVSPKPTKKKRRW
jgi:hypothetical protein